MSYDRREADRRYNRSEKGRARDARKRARRVERGLCIRCGVNEPELGRVKCCYCLWYTQDWNFLGWSNWRSGRNREEAQDRAERERWGEDKIFDPPPIMPNGFRMPR
jgi:hypothetical protein